MEIELEPLQSCDRIEHRHMFLFNMLMTVMLWVLTGWRPEVWLMGRWYVC